MDDLVPTYPSVQAALRSAYAAEVAEVWGYTPDPEAFGARPKDDDPEALASWADVTVETVLEYLDGSPSDSWADDLTQFEWLGQSVWTMNAVRRLLCPRLMATVDARYIVALNPDDDNAPQWREREPQYWADRKLYNQQHSRKRIACHRLADLVAKAGTYGRPERSYALDVVLSWAGLRKLVDAEVAERLGKNVSTLRRWRHGRGAFGPGVQCTLDAWLDEAHEALRVPFEDGGLVARSDDQNCYTVYMHSTKASA